MALLIDDAAVRRLLPMPECIEAMAEAFRALGQGKAVMPLRTMIRLPNDRGIFATMPAALAEPETFGIKVITVWPANEGTEYDSHQGMVVLFETQHGGVAALMDASAITALRTAAVTAVATRALARENTQTLALIGSGVQAATHLDAMLAVRRFMDVRVYSREHTNAQAFARTQSARTYVNVRAVASAEEAVRDADVICTLTSSAQPVVKGEWLKAGAHVNAIGASQRTARELDSEAVRRGALFADRKESMVNEAGDYLIPLSEGVITESHIRGELSDLMTGAPGRQSAEEITIFKSLGLAIEDLAAAQHIYAKALGESGIPRFEFGGKR